MADDAIIFANAAAGAADIEHDYDNEHNNNNNNNDYDDDDCDDDNVTEMDDQAEAKASQAKATKVKKKKKKKNGRVAAFLTKTFTIVDSAPTDELVGWTRGGEAFRITHPEELAKHVLPKFFKHNNMSSFVRQLNMYGFNKVGAPANMEFYNANFRQGRRDLLGNIVRKRGANAPHSQTATVNEMRGEVAELKRKRDEMEAEVSHLRDSQARIEAQVQAVLTSNAQLRHQVAEANRESAALAEYVQTIMTIVGTMVVDGAPSAKRQKVAAAAEAVAAPVAAPVEVVDMVAQPTVATANEVKMTGGLDPMANVVADDAFWSSFGGNNGGVAPFGAGTAAAAVVPAVAPIAANAINTDHNTAGANAAVAWLDLI